MTMAQGANEATSSRNLSRRWFAPPRSAGFMDAVHRKNVLGEIDTREYDGHGIPFRVT